MPRVKRPRTHLRSMFKNRRAVDRQHQPQLPFIAKGQHVEKQKEKDFPYDSHGRLKRNGQRLHLTPALWVWWDAPGM